MHHQPTLQDLVDGGLITSEDLARYRELPKEVAVGTPETIDSVEEVDIDEEYITDDYLEGLSEQEMLIVLLRFEEGLTTAQVGEALGLSSSFIRRVLKTAKATIWENISRIKGD